MTVCNKKKNNLLICVKFFNSYNFLKIKFHFKIPFFLFLMNYILFFNYL